MMATTTFDDVHDADYHHAASASPEKVSGTPAL
jgi:hypothetical protein